MSIGKRTMSRDKGEESRRLLAKYYAYARDIKRLLIVSGMWPSLHPTVQRLVTYFGLAVVSFSFVGGINFSLRYVSDIMLFTQTIGLIISMPGILMKICVFLSYRDELASLNAELTADFRRDLLNDTYAPLALTHYRAFANLTYALTTIVGLTSFLKSVIIPLLEAAHGRYPPSLPSIYPFGYEPGGAIYWLIQLIFVCAAFFIWSVTCAVDSALGHYTLQMCGELRVLAYRFENLRMSVDYRDYLKECVRRHYLLLRSRDTLERIFGIPVFWLAVTSALILCTFVFQLTEILKTMSVSKIVYISAFIALKLVQAYMYAWYGNLISHESDACLNAIYNCYWAGSGDARFMTDVLIVVSQRPLSFTAIGWLNVTMQMFTKIVQTSVSYFGLLQTLKKD